MSIINDIIYSYIIGDSYGLSMLNNEIDTEIKLQKNIELNIDKGYFSSMTSFMLATMDSITKMNNIDTKDILYKMCTCLIVGKYTNKGKVYDLDKVTYKVLEHFNKKNDLVIDYEELDKSSYSLSRLIPVILFNYYKTDNLDNLVKIISITNTNEEVLFGSYIYYKYMLNLLNGKDKYKALKIEIPKGFSNNIKNKYKHILKGQIYYKDIKFNNEISNVLSIIFYVILNTDNFTEIFLMLKHIEGNTNIYASLICAIAGILYGKDNIDEKLIKDIKNKKEINKYIKDFERILV